MGLNGITPTVETHLLVFYSLYGKAIFRYSPQVCQQRETSLFRHNQVDSQAPDNHPFRD